MAGKGGSLAGEKAPPGKLQTPSVQAPEKLQFPKSNQSPEVLLELGVWNFPGAWGLGFGTFPRLAAALDFAVSNGNLWP